MTAAEAVDAVFGVFKAVWDTTGFPAVYNDVGGTPAAGAWARATIQHERGRQASLSGGLGVKLWTQAGVVAVEVYAPIGDGRAEAYRLAELVVNGFRDARGSVWYRNPRMRERGANGAHQRIDVLADFIYDETR